MGASATRQLRASLAVRTVVLCLAAPLAAGAAGASSRTTLAALLDAARAENPEIRAAEARAGAMSQRPVQEGTLPDPMVGVKYHNERADRITLGQSDFSYVELSAEQEVPFPGKLALRSQIATREAARERAMRDTTELMVLGRVASAFADLAVAERSRTILNDNVGTLELMVRQAESSYGAGTTAQQDVLRATLERTMLDERIAMLEQKALVARATLNALLARPATQDLPPADWLPAPHAPAAFEDLVTRLVSSAPELRAAREEVLRSEDGLSLARREFLPDFAVMAGYMNKNGLFPEWEIGMRIKVPLYFWRRQGPAVTEAALNKEAAERTRENTQVTLEGKLRELHGMTETAFRLSQLYGKRLIPQATLTLDSSRASYAAGRVDFLTALTAFTTVLEYRLREAEETGNYFRARAEMGPLLGESPASWETVR